MRLCAVEHKIVFLSFWCIFLDEKMYQTNTLNVILF